VGCSSWDLHAPVRIGCRKGIQAERQRRSTEEEIMPEVRKRFKTLQEARAYAAKHSEVTWEGITRLSDKKEMEILPKLRMPKWLRF
jgi:hypothetical protein